MSASLHGRMVAVGLVSAFIGLLIIKYPVIPRWGQPPVSLRYRVEATVRMNGEVATGSSVWSATISFASTGGGRVINGFVRGEAIPVAFPNGQYAFVLRRGAGHFSAGVYGAFPLQCIKAADNEAETAAMLIAFEGPCEIRKYLPATVAFPNLGDPVIYRRPDWPVLTKPLATCLEPCLVRLVVTRTDEKMTTGLERLLPWLKRGVGSSIIGTDERQYGVGMENLYKMDFSTELD